MTDEGFKEVVETCHAYLTEQGQGPGPLLTRVRGVVHDFFKLQKKFLETERQLNTCQHVSKIHSDQQERYITRLLQQIESLNNGQEIGNIRLELVQTQIALKAANTKLGNIREALED